MASSESDEVSYYDKNKRNTFFTGSLLDTLIHGIDNSKEMLTLNDLYENAKAHLDQRQQPRYKDKLNISPADFFIARNPGFSLEKSIEYARQLFKAGSLSEALREFRKILKSQPGNQEVKDLAEQCNSDLLFTQFAKQGDDYFYQRHQYQQALDHYQQAYEIKPDFVIAEKIRNCKTSLQEGKMAEPTELKQAPVKLPDPIVEPVVKKEQDAIKEENEEQEKKSFPAKLLVLIIAVLVVLLGWWILAIVNGHEGKTNFTALGILLDSIPEQAMSQLQEAKEKDSAYYIIGNYYRADKKFDSAVYYYDKAIAVSNLPAAYSALAEIYYNYEIHDSTKMRSPGDILKKAASLFKADTSAYYLLGKIAEQNAIMYKRSMMPGADSLMEETERWYQKGFKKGSKQCATRLGFFYLYQQRDPVKAYPYLKASAENNILDAQLYLSEMLIRGNGVKKNVEEGNRWFGLYLKNADASAALHTASVYASKSRSDDDYIIETDCAKANMLANKTDSLVRYIRDEQERSQMYLDLGNFYWDKDTACNNYILDDRKRARAYYQKSADLGNGMANILLKDSTVRK
jgi:TPR repeat protein